MDTLSNKVVDTQEERLAEALAVIAYEQPEEPWRVAHDALKGTARPLSTQCSGDTQEVERACCGSREGMPHFWDCETNDPALRTHSPSEAEAAVNAIAKIEMDREGYPLSRSQEEIYADAWETFEAARAALSLPSDKTVELLREADGHLKQLADISGNIPWVAEITDLRARIDSHLGEMK